MTTKYSMSMPIGETVSGVSGPVFYDPHYATRINKPPVTLVTGSPGSGKTMASLLFAIHSALLNKVTFILDPKGDFLALKNLERAGFIENVAVWSIFDNESGEVNEENIGMLDPTCLTNDPAENASLTLETIRTLVKGLTASQRNALIPIIQDVVESKNPSLRMIITTLARSQHDEISTLSHELNMAVSTQAGKLLVASSKHTNKLNLTSGVVVASLMGLSLPSSTKSEESYLERERVSVAILRLLTHLVLDVMKKTPKSVNKTLIIDEAWAIFNNEAGRPLIDEVSLLGRSLNMATILATQSPTHIQDAKGESSLDNTISTRFAFRNTSKSDNIMTIESMGLSNKNYAQTIASLDVGTCLMKDSQDQFAFVDILIFQDWVEILSTTPEPDKLR